MREYLDEWLWAKQALRPSTHAAHKAHLRNYVVPYLGELPLSQVTTRTIEGMYADIGAEERLSPVTVRRIHATLTSALNSAVKRGLPDG